MKSLISLPLSVKHAVQRWYLVSSWCLLVTLLSLTSFHWYLVTHVPVTHTSSPAHDPLVTVSPGQTTDTTAALQEQITILTTVLTRSDNAPQLAPLVRHCMSTVPQQIHITSCTICEYARIQVSGIATQSNAIIDYMQQLQVVPTGAATGYTMNAADIHTQNTLNNSPQMYTFTITIAQPGFCEKESVHHETDTGNL